MVDLSTLASPAPYHVLRCAPATEPNSLHSSIADPPSSYGTLLGTQFFQVDAQIPQIQDFD